MIRIIWKSKFFRIRSKATCSLNPQRKEKQLLLCFVVFVLMLSARIINCCDRKGTENKNKRTNNGYLKKMMMMIHRWSTSLISDAFQTILVLFSLFSFFNFRQNNVLQVSFLRVSRILGFFFSAFLYVLQVACNYLILLFLFFFFFENKIEIYSSMEFNPRYEDWFDFPE